MIHKSAQQLAFRCNCIRAVDVAHPIPPQAPTAAGASSDADRRGKAPVQTMTPNEDEEESKEETDVDAFFNTAMFATQPVMKC
jgi:ribosomal protein L12E/L44/L45/RPP1/RPP2